MNELMTAPTTDEIIRNAQYHQAQRVVELLLSKGLITPPPPQSTRKSQTSTV